MSFAGHWQGYLAGPMTIRYAAGVKDWNYSEFNRITGRLRAAGHTIHNPAEHFGGDPKAPGKVRADYIRAAIEGVAESNYIILIPGWEESPGANLELDVALELGHMVYEYIEDPWDDNEDFWYLRPSAVRRRPPRKSAA